MGKTSEPKTFGLNRFATDGLRAGSAEEIARWAMARSSGATPERVRKGLSQIDRASAILNYAGSQVDDDTLWSILALDVPRGPPRARVVVSRAYKAASEVACAYSDRLDAGLEIQRIDRALERISRAWDDLAIDPLLYCLSVSPDDRRFLDGDLAVFWDVLRGLRRRAATAIKQSSRGSIVWRGRSETAASGERRGVVRNVPLEFFVLRLAEVVTISTGRVPPLSRATGGTPWAVLLNGALDAVAWPRSSLGDTWRDGAVRKVGKVWRTGEDGLEELAEFVQDPSNGPLRWTQLPSAAIVTDCLVDHQI